MRVLLLSTISPYPKNVGKKVVLGGFCDYFKKTLSPADFHVMCFEPADVGPGIGVTVVPKPRMLNKVVNLGWWSLLARRKSIQESLFWSPEALHAIESKIAEFRPDLVIFDTIRIGQYLRHLPGKSFNSVLYMEDLFSVRYERILRAMAKFPDAAIDAMGNFAANIPGFLLPLYQSSRMVKRLLLQLERKLVQHTEYTMPAAFDAALLINEQEVRHLEQKTGLANVRVVSPMLNMDSQERLVPRAWSGRPEFVFLGSLNLAHNAFSIENFIERHMDEMIARIPGCLLRIIGRHPSPELVQLAAKYGKNVVVEGFVEDLDEVLSRCAGMIAPLLFGSGVKIKVIDAVRLGVPVVSTSYGAEGIALRAEGGILVDDELSHFAELCAGLLEPEANAHHSRFSRQIYLDSYSTGAVKAQYETFFSAG